MDGQNFSLRKAKFLMNYLFGQSNRREYLHLYKFNDNLAVIMLCETLYSTAIIISSELCACMRNACVWQY